VNGHHVFGINCPQTIHGTSHDVQNPAQAFLADGHHDRGPGILRGHAPDQTIGNIHSNTAHDVVTQMLGDLDDQVVFLVINSGVGYED